MYISKTLKTQKGFTLIEMLIVISIIAMLAVMSVAGYTAFRKASLIDLSADSLIAQLDEMREKAIHGTKAGVDSEGEEYLKCYGLKISKGGGGDGEYEMSAVNYRFTNKKVWKEGRWQYQGCADAGDPGIFEMDRMVEVAELKESGWVGVEKEVTASELIFRFLPPNGDLEVLNDGSFKEGKGFMTVKMRYGGGSDDRYSRTIKIDLASGQAVKIKNE